MNCYQFVNHKLEEVWVIFQVKNFISTILFNDFNMDDSV